MTNKFLITTKLNVIINKLISKFSYSNYASLNWELVYVNGSSSHFHQSHLNENLHNYRLGYVEEHIAYYLSWQLLQADNYYGDLDLEFAQKQDLEKWRSYWGDWWSIEISWLSPTILWLGLIGSGSFAVLWDAM